LTRGKETEFLTIKGSSGTTHLLTTPTMIAWTGWDSIAGLHLPSQTMWEEPVPASCKAIWQGSGTQTFAAWSSSDPRYLVLMTEKGSYYSRDSLKTISCWSLDSVGA